MDDSGFVDWEAYGNARDEILAKMDPADADAIRRAEQFLDPAVEALDRQFRAAREVRRDLGDISKWKGMTPEGSKEYDKFAAKVSREAPRIAADLGRRVKLKDVAAYLADRMNKPVLGEIFSILQSTKEREARRNPQYDAFLRGNAHILEEFYPELYSQAAMERIGLIEGAEDDGVQPLQPLQSTEPLQPIGSSR